ncbi:MAG: AtpZ/AtpI family protein [Bacteroidetes bacterium]|nr:MAG: AtpZ/AtpI family protein [Bacteroidota bacterium]
MQTNLPKTPKKKQPDYSYMRYASMGTQMLVIIGLGVFGGYYLDKYLELKIPVFTLVLSLSSVAIAIYLSIKDFLKK